MKRKIKGDYWSNYKDYYVKRYSVSIFFPAYNDECTIEKITLIAMETIRKFTDDFEVIIVDDCSIDRTGEISDTLAEKFKEVKVIHHTRNRGYGGALKTGFENCSKELIFYTDGDAQYNVQELSLLFRYIDDYDVVYGYRLKRADNWYRALLGTLYHYFINFFFNLNVKDVDSDFRLMKRKIFENMQFNSNSGAICVELMKQIAMNGYKIKEVPVTHFPRVYGRSQFFNPKKILYLFKDLIPMWFRFMIVRWKHETI